MTFRFQRKTAGITYSKKGDLTKESLARSLNEKFDDIDVLVIGEERYSTGGIHYHAYIEFENKKNYKDCRVFDVDDCHPSIEKLKWGKNKWIGYITKHDPAPYQQGIDVKEHLDACKKKGSRRYLKLAIKIKQGKTMEELDEKYSDLIMLNKRKIEEYGKYQKEKTQLTERRIGFRIVPLTVVDEIYAPMENKMNTDNEKEKEKDSEDGTREIDAYRIGVLCEEDREKLSVLVRWYNFRLCERKWNKQWSGLYLYSKEKSIGKTTLCGLLEKIDNTYFWDLEDSGWQESWINNLPYKLIVFNGLNAPLIPFQMVEWLGDRREITVRQRNQTCPDRIPSCTPYIITSNRPPEGIGYDGKKDMSIWDERMLIIRITFPLFPFIEAMARIHGVEQQEDFSIPIKKARYD